MVLRPVVALAEAADVAHHGGAEHREVAGVVLAAEPLGRPGRLLEEVEETTRVVDLVLVGVEVVDLGHRLDGGGHVLQGALDDQVVVVDQGDELAARNADAVVGGLDDVTVLAPLDDPDPRVARGRAPQQLSHPGIGRQVVDQDQLPVGEGLGADRVDHRLEHVERRVVDRRDDREHRRGRRCFGGLLAERFSHRRRDRGGPGWRGRGPDAGRVHAASCRRLSSGREAAA